MESNNKGRIWKCVALVGTIVTVASFLFAIQQRTIRNNIRQENRKNTWATYKDWQTIYSGFEDVGDGKITGDDYVKGNRKSFGNVNDSIIAYIWSLYETKTREEQMELLEGWVKDGRVPSHAVDEFQAHITDKD